MRADSSQSIKDSVYLEWVKTKEDERKRQQEERKRWKEENTKRIDKSTIERKIQQDAQNLERWRKQKDEEIRQKKQEELRLKQELRENKKQAQLQKIKVNEFPKQKGKIFVLCFFLLRMQKLVLMIGKKRKTTN